MVLVVASTGGYSYLMSSSPFDVNISLWDDLQCISSFEQSIEQPHDCCTYIQSCYNILLLLLIHHLCAVCFPFRYSPAVVFCLPLVLFPSTLVCNAHYFARYVLWWMSVCVSACHFVSVCLSARISPEPHARSLPVFVLVACVRGSVLLRHVDDRPHRLLAARERTARAKCNLRLPCCLQCFDTVGWASGRVSGL